LRKLYKQIGDVLHYHEAWGEGREIVEHWGIVGQRGDSKRHRRGILSTESGAISEILRPAEAAGYGPIDDDDHARAMIEFPAEGFGTSEDVDKLERLRHRMDELLGWTGLGNCDGYSVGSGTMEACCYVVDYDCAARIIAADLADSEFSDFTRIYDENAEP
jgi:hypothetical protein